MGLGDAIMSTVDARRAKKEHPGKYIFFGNGRVAEWSDAWERNPNINHPNDVMKANREQKAVWIPNYTGSRPYIKGVTPTNIIYNEDFSPEPGDVFPTPRDIQLGAEKAGTSFVLIEPHIKGSFSGNKAWVWDRWQNVVDGLRHPVVQIGIPEKRPLRNVKFVATGTFHKALGVLKHAALLITTDGALHHAAAALGIPTVVLWGARTHPRILGYESQTNIYTGHGESCGSMAPCQHCVDAMKRIQPDHVLHEARSILENRNSLPVAV